jgi:hypothetical protein
MRTAVVGDHPIGALNQRGQRDETGVASEIEKLRSGIRAAVVHVVAAGPNDLVRLVLAQDQLRQLLETAPAFFRAATIGEHRRRAAPTPPRGERKAEAVDRPKPQLTRELGGQAEHRKELKQNFQRVAALALGGNATR